MKRSRKKGTTNIFVEILGWYGVIVIIIAYALLNFNIFTTSNIFYQILNITGALGIMLEAYTKKDYQPVLLNLIWFLIALIAILRIFI